MKTQKQGEKKYEVFYDKRIGGVGSVVVIATSYDNALKNARLLTYTGSNFRDAKEVSWEAPTDGGNTRGHNGMANN